MDDLFIDLFMPVRNKHRDTTFGIRTNTKAKGCIFIATFMSIWNIHELKLGEGRGRARAEP